MRTFPIAKSFNCETQMFKARPDWTTTDLIWLTKLKAPVLVIRNIPSHTVGQKLGAHQLLLKNHATNLANPWCHSPGNRNLLHHKVRHMMHDFPTMRAVGTQTHLTHRSLLLAGRWYFYMSKWSNKNFIIEGLNDLKPSFCTNLPPQNFFWIWHLYFSSSGQDLSQPQGVEVEAVTKHQLLGGQ